MDICGCEEIERTELMLSLTVFTLIIGIVNLECWTVSTEQLGTWIICLSILISKRKIWKLYFLIFNPLFCYLSHKIYYFFLQNSWSKKIWQISLFFLKFYIFLPSLFSPSFLLSLIFILFLFLPFIYNFFTFFLTSQHCLCFPF